MTEGVTAIIIARGGSKGIPGKNVTDFCGKPLIVWTIMQAQDSVEIDTVVVSSDDDTILSIAVDYGAIPVRRPPEVASDTATSEVAWLHALSILEGQRMPMNLLVLPQCTSPVREPSDFDGAIRMFRSGNYDTLFSGTEFDSFIWSERNSGELNSLTYDYADRPRRQDADRKIMENGSFWVLRPEFLRKTGNRLGGRIGVFEMPKWKAMQIDEQEDLRLCALLMREYLLH